MVFSESVELHSRISRMSDGDTYLGSVGVVAGFGSFPLHVHCLACGLTGDERRLWDTRGFYYGHIEHLSRRLFWFLYKVCGEIGGYICRFSTAALRGTFSLLLYLIMRAMHEGSLAGTQ